MPQIETTHFQRHPNLDGGSPEETAFLVPMAERAISYICGFDWAPPIKNLYLAFGIGKIIALFLVQFERPIEGNTEEELWLVVGDLPSAYFVTGAAPDPAEALTAYCELMDDWSDCVLEGHDLKRCYPVPVEPTVEHAQMLKSRVKTIRNDFVPMAEAGEIIPQILSYQSS